MTRKIAETKSKGDRSDRMIIAGDNQRRHGRQRISDPRTCIRQVWFSVLLSCLILLTIDPVGIVQKKTLLLSAERCFRSRGRNAMAEQSSEKSICPSCEQRTSVPHRSHRHLVRSVLENHDFAGCRVSPADPRCGRGRREIRANCGCECAASGRIHCRRC